jgi:hypothetical protein
MTRPPTPAQAEAIAAVCAHVAARITGISRGDPAADQLAAEVFEAGVAALRLADELRQHPSYRQAHARGERGRHGPRRG